MRAVPRPRRSPTWVDQKPSCAASFTAYPGVDQVGCEARAASLATRSIKTSAKLWALEMAISMVDLTTLEGADTPGKVLSLCAKARRPDPVDRRRARGRGGVHLPRSRARRQAGPGGLAASRWPRSRQLSPRGAPRSTVKLADVRDAVVAGADEVDMVIDRGAFLSGRYGLVLEEIQAVKEACGHART